MCKCRGATKTTLRMPLNRSLGIGITTTILQNLHRRQVSIVPFSNHRAESECNHLPSPEVNFNSPALDPTTTHSYLPSTMHLFKKRPPATPPSLLLVRFEWHFMNAFRLINSPPAEEEAEVTLVMSSTWDRMVVWASPSQGYCQ